MTPQERQLVSDLFDRLAALESAPRDPDAERLIADGFARAPHAAYALVQTALVQDEALKRADAKIRELSGADAATPAGGSFLDAMRSALGTQNGPAASGRGTTSVPSVRPAPADQPDPRWNSGAALGAAPQQAAPYAPQPSTGGSFLGTAAASAAGVIGGALLFNSIGSLFGHHNSGSAFADVPSAQPFSSPWDNSAAGSDLSRDAGLNDIGGGGQNNFGGFDNANQSAGLFDAGSDYDNNGVDLADNSSDFDSGFGSDFGGGDFGGGDSA
ncbi:MAG: DUF2076 family protein [Rhodopseudomonas sp.]|nr:DUF2076 family protein [Rhodopseudomonas sp.]